MIEDLLCPDGTLPMYKIAGSKPPMGKQRKQMFEFNFNKVV